MKTKTRKAILLVVTCSMLGGFAGAKDDDKKKLSVLALGYQAAPREWTTQLVIPGYSYTSCRDVPVHTDYDFLCGVLPCTVRQCQTFTALPRIVPYTVGLMDWINTVELDGSAYTLACTAHWTGSHCGALIPGRTYPAEIKKGWMWITTPKQYVDERHGRSKFWIVDIQKHSWLEGGDLR